MPMRFYGPPRKMKVAHMGYTQIPDWLQKQERDPFDYKLRSKEEIKEQLHYYPPDFSWHIDMKTYPSGDIR